MKKNCVSIYKIFPGMGKKKIKNSTASKNFHNRNNNIAPRKKKWKIGMFDNDISHNGFISICLMLKSIGIPISTM